MPTLITIYWRDIPAQVITKQGRKRSRKKLTERFEKAIDRAAIRAKKTDSDAYLDDWRRENISLQGSLDTLAKIEAQRIEKDYDDERLLALIRNKGLEPG